ncbi:ABC transporter ATP-binding protein [Eubacterium sp. MSJ-33]|uniref:ABC transporter ATP-binding protein n=1 Tax=Eubacterium sp. MSJ-33 TaxID=2841528 RepID=UPI001C75BC39|nr:ABC transporter ATP-binding protein [Eubacterium sp. MSJ-33]QWT53822.1 ABC transporter ATP-binding protein/permease [Eubacterium sp. MSJ-33]
MPKDKKKKLQGFDKAVLKRVLTHIKKYRILVVFSFICAMITVASTLYAPILTGDAIDLIVGKGMVDFDGIKDIIYTFLMVTVVTVLSQWFMNIINNHITYSVVRDIRIEVFNHMEELPLSYIDSHKHGDIVSRIVSDIDQFADGLLMGFTQLFSGIVTILATLGFMIAVNVPIALVVIVLTPLSLFVASFIAKRTYHLFHRQSETRGDITSLVDEMIGQQKIVQAFGYEDEALERFGEINDRLEKDSMSATFYSSIVNPCTRFLNNLVYAAVGIIGAVSVISTGFTVGQLTCFLSYANQYTKPFNEISNVITELQNAMACAGRVFELLDETPQIPEKENAHVLKDTQGAIEINDVNFSYVKDKKLITDLNLSVKPGMRVAIVGPTGCGKSTLINLLMRFYDVDAGAISVDGTDIRDMTRDSLRQNYGMVLQETWLKSGTIRENIAYGKPDATDEEIVQAAKLAHSDSFIRRLPQGYDTVIAEDGGNLSQGQKQLLCITRVMLLLPPMLILDEATSSIDTRTEIRIQKAFNRMMQGRTSFIVAHRLSTIREADVILVMKDGNIIEKGNHEQLMAQNGFYTNLYNSQFAH